VLGCPEICQRSEHYKFLMDKIRASGHRFQYQDLI
jgi:hypothetical protein